MEITNKSGSFRTDRLLHIALLAVTVLILATGLGAIVVLRIQPAKQVAPTSFHIWSAADAMAAFREAGLDAEIIRGGPKDERDGFAAMMQVESLRFLVPSSGQTGGGMILSFHKATDLGSVRHYYVGLNKSLPRFKSWVYVKNNILLQLNGDIPEATALKYGAALNAMGVQ